MPLNAFRSLLDAHPFKGRSTQNAISRMQLNYALLASAYLNLPAPPAWPMTGYNRAIWDADRRALDRLMFVYYADRLKALIEDAIHIFIDNDPRRALQLTPKHATWSIPSFTVEDIRPAVEEAGNQATRGAYADVAKRVQSVFGIKIFSSAELKYLTYIAEARNLIVHRDEIVDRRFVEKSHSSQPIGSTVKLPSVSRMATRAILLPAKVASRLA